MKITIEIGGKDYGFEMNRANYKKLLADEEYAKIQNELNKLKNKNQDLANNDDISHLMLQNLVMEEQIFYYSLLMHQPNMTIEEASNLLDIVYDDYGFEEVGKLCTKIIENFTQKGEQPKKTMIMRMG